MYIFSPCSYVKNLRKNKKIEKENKEKKFLSEEEKKDKKKKTCMLSHRSREYLQAGLFWRNLQKGKSVVTSPWLMRPLCELNTTLRNMRKLTSVFLRKHRTSVYSRNAPYS